MERESTASPGRGRCARGRRRRNEEGRQRYNAQLIMIRREFSITWGLHHAV
uniref:Uncharacterized protein n=1 Tax=Setaria viridis TaxID=4556 RepID=A0A4U6U7G4_SETVI|nr:hypothetical protein SEVIR_6G087650v2 [Setaria viridis]